jgi:hypothetical protein
MTNIEQYALVEDLEAPILPPVAHRAIQVRATLTGEVVSGIEHYVAEVWHGHSPE